MTGRPRGRREYPPQPEGAPAVRIQGHRRDVDRVVELMRAAGIQVWDSPAVVYPDRNGVTVRRYVTVDLRVDGVARLNANVDDRAHDDGTRGRGPDAVDEAGR